MSIWVTTGQVRALTGLQRAGDISDADITSSIDDAEAWCWNQAGGSLSKVLADDGTVVPTTAGSAGRAQFITAAKYRSAALVLSTWVSSPNVDKVMLYDKLAENAIFLFRTKFMGKAKGSGS